MYCSSVAEHLKGIDEAIRRRMKGAVMGFNIHHQRPSRTGIKDVLREIQPVDLLQFGLILEFIGRVAGDRYPLISWMKRPWSEF